VGQAVRLGPVHREVALVVRVVLVVRVRVVRVREVAPVVVLAQVVVVRRTNVVVNMDIAVQLALIVGQVVRVDPVHLEVALVVLVVRVLVLVVLPRKLVAMQHIMMLDWEAVVGRTQTLTI